LAFTAGKITRLYSTTGTIPTLNGATIYGASALVCTAATGVRLATASPFASVNLRQTSGPALGVIDLTADTVRVIGLLRSAAWSQLDSFWTDTLAATAGKITRLYASKISGTDTIWTTMITGSGGPGGSGSVRLHPGASFNQYIPGTVQCSTGSYELTCKDSEGAFNINWSGDMDITVIDDVNMVNHFRVTTDSFGITGRLDVIGSGTIDTLTGIDSLDANSGRIDRLYANTIQDDGEIAIACSVFSVDSVFQIKASVAPPVNLANGMMWWTSNGNDSVYIYLNGKQVFLGSGD